MLLTGARNSGLSGGAICPPPLFVDTNFSERDRVNRKCRVQSN